MASASTAGDRVTGHSGRSSTTVAHLTLLLAMLVASPAATNVQTRNTVVPGHAGANQLSGPGGRNKSFLVTERLGESSMPALGLRVGQGRHKVLDLRTGEQEIEISIGEVAVAPIEAIDGTARYEAVVHGRDNRRLLVSAVTHRSGPGYEAHVEATFFTGDPTDVQGPEDSRIHSRLYTSLHQVGAGAEQQHPHFDLHAIRSLFDLSASSGLTIVTRGILPAPRIPNVTDRETGQSATEHPARRAPAPSFAFGTPKAGDNSSGDAVPKTVEISGKPDLRHLPLLWTGDDPQTLGPTWLDSHF